MIFDNTISIAEIISIVAILCTFVTILQVKQQRIDSVKPYITIKPIDKSYNYKKDDLEHSVNFELFASNIGNGLAKNASLKFNIVNVPEILSDDSLVIANNYFEVNKRTFYLLHHDIDFTYFESQEQHDISGTLDNYIILMCRLYMKVLISSKKNIDALSSLKVVVKIEYFSVLKERLHNYLGISLNPITIAEDEINFYIDIQEMSKREYRNYTRKTVCKKNQKQHKSI